ncbi:MAG TPA: IS66 family transposase [Kiritimatiellia bacterium]|nr:IS66 family transposase [Kiritimatiellia bacterium]
MIATPDKPQQTKIPTLEEALRMIQGMEQENRLLREELRLLKHHLFGRKRERGPENHPELFAVEPTPPPEPLPVKIEAHTRRNKRKHPGRRPFPDHLPREVVEIPLPESERACGQCGETKEKIGVEITQELEVVPAKLFVREYHREKCACRKCLGEVTTAPAPSRPIEKGMAGPGLLAQVIVDKYCDHVPLYRQEKRFAREGIFLTRKTLCGWLGQMHSPLALIVRVMRDDLTAGGYLQVDEVPVSVQDPRYPGKNRTAHLWTYSRPGGPVIFDFQMSRSRAGPAKFLEFYRGILQHDGYDVYLCLSGDLVHVACMAHIRRKFWEVAKAGDRRAEPVVRAINRLYKIEREAREKQLDAEARHALRARKSARRMDLLKRRIEKIMVQVLPRSALGKACAYALGQWPAMMHYLDDGRIEIDNNLCENTVRPITLGRKNWLHIGRDHAGPWMATYASLAETCRRLGINPYDYFRDVITRIADHPINRIAELTPANWKAAREQTADQQS